MEDILRQFDAFLLAFLRITAFLFFMPVFSSRVIPALARLGLAFFLTLCLFYPFSSLFKISPLSSWELGLYALREFFVGIVMGTFVSIIFSAFQLAGTIYGYQMGFGVISILDPEAMESVSLTGQLKYLLAMFLFLETNCHHNLLLALFNSFNVVPLGSAKITKGLVKEIFLVFSGSFIIAVQIALPIIAILLMIDIALGIIGRTIPQLNVFIIGFPLKIGVATLTLIFLLPALRVLMGGLLNGLAQGVDKVLFYIK